MKAQHDPDIDSAAVSAHGDEVRSDAETAQAIGLVTDTTTAEGFRALEGGKTVCEVGFWNYIERKCSVGGKHKLQRPRAANEAATIAALPLGRSALPAPASSAASLDFTGTADAPELTPAVSDPLGSTAAPKKARKSLPSRNRGHDLSRDWKWRGDRWSARAYALPDDGYRRGRSERSWSWSW